MIICQYQSDTRIVELEDDEFSGEFIVSEYVATADGFDCVFDSLINSFEDAAECYNAIVNEGGAA
jgi:hypothetical protein